MSEKLFLQPQASDFHNFIASPLVESEVSKRRQRHLHKGPNRNFLLHKCREVQWLMQRSLKKKKTEHIYLYILTLLFCSLPSETGGALPSEPPWADCLWVPRPGGVRVQPAPAGARDHAPLQTPAADLLALVVRQEDDRPVLLLTGRSKTASSLPSLPSSSLVTVTPVVAWQQLLGILLPDTSQRGCNLLASPLSSPHHRHNYDIKRVQELHKFLFLPSFRCIF